MINNLGRQAHKKFIIDLIWKWRRVVRVAQLFLSLLMAVNSVIVLCTVSISCFNLSKLIGVLFFCFFSEMYSRWILVTLHCLKVMKWYVSLFVTKILFFLSTCCIECIPLYFLRKKFVSSGCDNFYRRKYSFVEFVLITSGTWVIRYFTLMAETTME